VQVVAVMTPARGAVAPLIDLAHREPVAALHAEREGMTDSPTSGPVHSRGTGTGACAPNAHAHDRPEPHRGHLPRPEQRAPAGVGVKDLRPQGGRPFGSILDPDASARRAHKQAKKQKNKRSTTKIRGDRPRSFRNDFQYCHLRRLTCIS
jgi:hypothetical protein